MPPKVHHESGQQGTIMVENLFQCSGSHWSLNYDLENYHFRVEHRLRTQHRNADGLSKRTNDCWWREQELAKLQPVAERWNFLPQEKYERLPIASYERPCMIVMPELYQNEILFRANDALGHQAAISMSWSNTIL